MSKSRELIESYFSSPYTGPSYFAPSYFPDAGGTVTPPTPGPGDGEFDGGLSPAHLGGRGGRGAARAAFLRRKRDDANVIAAALSILNRI